MKKDPLLPLFFDERSGNSLVHYNAKLDKRFFSDRKRFRCGREHSMALGLDLRPNSNFAGKSRDHCPQKSFVVAASHSPPKTIPVTFSNFYEKLRIL
ncbi:hypothetical protein NE619_14035 [Anaerovorax odorimutans]|uniref:Uncharacterized protein n=1 Tax=Anaerovorax odorimutans TaxID=109327 RepID=A0ABT1RRM7_9FIRM|nr:hypothetical protein [Anaerovorax odorimutans]